ncbi:RNA polymerase II transcription factor B subunit 4 [Kickxella alabastrina]|uniref:RNA polymerase II transcription factor B subunit 4 n=1 Tax=Kickxella alabastrina TaxID=61397 RepID=A0ACC1I7P0_9FUNG|nr:RNA polymerase II transcription factor B subunit 4 [Kickxella alabastrina]
MSEPLESDASLLVVVLDINTNAWSTSPLPLDKALQQIIIFINGYLALKPENKLVVLASNKRECRCLYPVDHTSATPDQDIQVYEQFRVVDASILAGVKNMIINTEPPNANQGIEEAQSLIARALSKALCHIHRVTESMLSKIWPRILVLSAAEDSPREYIALMNSIFAAQKMSVLIDICKIIGRDSVFLQQAAEISGGNYLRVDTARGESLLQTLLFTCLADHYTREILYFPGNEQIDFRATCFCHKKVVDIGFVCSVCLSIFCRPAPVCSTCQTKFSIKLVKTESALSSSALTNNGKQMFAASEMSALSLEDKKTATAAK